MLSVLVFGCGADCGGCNLKFSHPLYYRLHCTVFHDPQFSLTIRKYHCKVCGMAVLGKENIVRHAVAKHEGKGAYQCQYCKKVLVRMPDRVRDSVGVIQLTNSCLPLSTSCA
jgi:hypothetical protein